MRRFDVISDNLEKIIDLAKETLVEVDGEELQQKGLEDIITIAEVVLTDVRAARILK